MKNIAKLLIILAMVCNLPVRTSTTPLTLEGRARLVENQPASTSINQDQKMRTQINF